MTYSGRYSDSVASARAAAKRARQARCYCSALAKGEICGFCEAQIEAQQDRDADREAGL